MCTIIFYLKYTMYATFASKCWRWPVHVQSWHNSGSLMAKCHIEQLWTGLEGTKKQTRWKIIRPVCTGLIKDIKQYIYLPPDFLQHSRLYWWDGNVWIYHILPKYFCLLCERRRQWGGLDYRPIKIIRSAGKKN